MCVNVCPCLGLVSGPGDGARSQPLDSRALEYHHQHGCGGGLELQPGLPKEDPPGHPPLAVLPGTVSPTYTTLE